MPQTQNSILADLNYFHALMEKEPESLYYIPVASMYIKLEKYDEALPICRQGLEIYPDLTHLKVLYAEALMHTGMHDEAIDLLFDVIIDDEDNFKASKLIGKIYLETDNGAEAVNYLKAAYLRAPEDPELMSFLNDAGILDDIAKPTEEQESEPSDYEYDYKDDEETLVYFNIDEDLKEADIAINDLIKDIGALKAQGKTAEQMFENEDSAENHSQIEDFEEISGEELSDDEIIASLSGAEYINTMTTPQADSNDEEDSFIQFNTDDIKQIEQAFQNSIKTDELPFIDSENTTDEANINNTFILEDDFVLKDEEELTDEFIPHDLVQSVLSESGIDNMEDIFTDDDKITPETIKGDNDAK